MVDRSLKIFVKGKLVFQYSRFPRDFKPEDVSFTIEDTETCNATPKRIFSDEGDD